MLRNAALLGSAEKLESWSYTVYVSEDTEYQSAIPINLYGQDESITLYIDWGDESEETLTVASYEEDETAGIHTFSAEGEYTITISSKEWRKIYLESAYGVGSNSTPEYLPQFAVFRLTLTSILTPYPRFKGVHYFYSDGATEFFEEDSALCLLQACINLKSIPKGLFDECRTLTTFRGVFWSCASLTAIPEGLFDNELITSFRGTFCGCTSLTSIPEGLFDRCTAVTTFYQCFYNCTSLTAIPDGLFNNCTAVTTFANCFRGCTSLTEIPTGLFDNNTAVANFSYCFYNCTSLTEIPEGLFLYNTKVTTFDYCFYNSFKCDSSIHIGSEVVTTATSFMYSSSSYDRYVYVPAGSTTADTFNALSISGMTVVEE